jgi:hypothetical protein
MSATEAIADSQFRVTGVTGGIFPWDPEIVCKPSVSN